jgi:hypothetical protein
VLADQTCEYALAPKRLPVFTLAEQLGYLLGTSTFHHVVTDI